MNVRLIIIQFVLIACTSCSSDKTLIKGCGIPIVLNEIKTSLVDTAFFQAAHWVKFLCIVLQESIWDKLMI